MKLRRTNSIKVFLILLVFLTSACGLRVYDVVIPRLETLQVKLNSQTPSPAPPSATLIIPTPNATLTPSPTRSPSPTPTLNQVVTPCVTSEADTSVTLVNHAPYTIYITLLDVCANQFGFPLAAAFTRKVQFPGGEYSYRILIPGIQEVTGKKVFPAGSLITWDFYETATILDSPTPLFTNVP
jgi:hypothetical protein